MEKMNFNKSHGIIYGSDTARYQQDGKLYDGLGNLVSKPDKLPDDDVKDSLVIATDEVESAKRFLIAVLKGGPLAKSVVYKAAEDNNQPWLNVTSAFNVMNVSKFKYKNQETWKLPEEFL